MIGRAVALAMLVACSSGASDPAPAPVQAPPKAVPPPPGRTDIGTAPGLDGDPRPRMPREPGKKQPSRPIEIMLKSTPERAMAAVDGIQIGLTPVYWLGDADGREHEFTFVKEGYALGRHRFVPVQSGVVHTRLIAVLTDLPDAGVGEPVQPPPPIAPPPTVITPDAAPVAPPPPVMLAPDAAPSGSGAN